jgi:hypothetical protein
MIMSSRSVARDGHLSTRAVAGLALLAVLALAACDKAQLLAPTNSTIVISAADQILPTGGRTEVTAMVTEQSGTAVHNGTTVRFTTNLGRLEPAEAQTHNGAARVMFVAGDVSGVAQIRAVSGGASGGGGTDTTVTNVVQITVGAAAVGTITLRANPASVGPNGGTVELIANVVAESGRALEGILVTFSTDQGQLASSTATSNSNGEARTTLTTSQQAVVTATAGTKTSGNVTISVRAAPGVTVTCAPAGAAAGGNCSAVQPTGASNTANVVFTVTKPTGTSNLRSATIDFGDGSSQALGNLAGEAIVAHVYAGPSGSSPVTYIATVTAVDINGEVATVTVPVNVIPRAPLGVSLTVTPGTSVVGVGQSVTFTATVTPAVGGADAVESFTWDFGDNETATTAGGTTSHVYTGSPTRRTVTVTVRTTDGRTATARAEFIAGG